MKKLKEQIEQFKPYNEQERVDREMMLKYINTFENVLTRENKMCHFTASAWIVNKERTKVLMIYHNIYKSWAWAGGHADGDSNLLHVALKEVNEETGLENIKVLSDGIYGLQILTVDSHIKRGKFVPSHLHLDCCFLLEADEKEKTRIKEDENSGVKWIDINEAIKITKEKDADVLIVDTAGRLHNKKYLMDELNKIQKVINKEMQEADKEVLLVIDGTTGQNAISQVKAFKEEADLTGLVITKLDGTAKGGVAIGIVEENKIPIKFIGVGEQIDDMEIFNSEDFVKAII